MIRNRIYYLIKPLVPASVRLAIRRWWAASKRDKVKDQWPILPGSEKIPENWTGWPERKRFAFVLTHDVEGPDGLKKCRRLMELELRHGFRSSFNFIPEGNYSVTKELRDELTQNGFEVGVHDLHHNGKLFDRRSDFAKSAVRINRHLKEWGAVGFRSGFMLRNLDWLRDLEIAYDGSSFDTDPFEPQPDGAGTIFPFWIPGSNARFNGHKGYVELPYTLPQDSTLFLLLREKSIDIWKRKLDWIASKGGMTLVNVHPDYISFSDSSAATNEFPVSFYEELLTYIKTKYEGAYWNALPKEVASYFVCCKEQSGLSSPLASQAQSKNLPAVPLEKSNTEEEKTSRCFGATRVEAVL